MTGLFIAIEGGDGSGKGTQAKALAERAKQEGYDVLTLSFPQYESASSRYASRYLNGVYGEANDVHPELASLAYAIDRWHASAKIRHHLKKPRSLVIADRWIASNCAHQGTKYDTLDERRQFYRENFELEYDILKEPVPDVSIVLLVPSDLAQANVDKKSVRSYTTMKRDIHERDADHLTKAKRNYEELVALYPDNFKAIECLDGKNMRPIAAIHDDIWTLVKEREQGKNHG